MATKLSERWSLALMLSILVLMIGFLGLGVRAFASAAISDSIFLAALGVVLLILPLYFVFHGREGGGLIERRSVRLSRYAWPGRIDRRRPPVRGRERAAVANERRIKQLAGFSTPKLVSASRHD
jgi:uncharacterized membrane protein YfcA